MELKKALEIVKENGYKVIKLSKQQKEDMDICNKCGGNSDCLECSCNICLMQE